jgi:hypothetical protein
MKLIRLSILIFVSALSLAALGCHQAAEPENTNSSAAQAAREVEKEDGSTVAVVDAPDGTKTEVRSFKTGEVARVTRTTRPGGGRSATVELRDGRKAELEDEGDIERAMDATADALTAAANKTWDTTKDVAGAVGDKTEDAAGKAASTGKKVGQEVGDKAEDAAGAVKKGAQKVGRGAKKVGSKIKDTVNP